MELGLIDASQPAARNNRGASEVSPCPLSDIAAACRAMFLDAYIRVQGPVEKCARHWSWRHRRSCRVGALLERRGLLSALDRDTQWSVLSSATHPELPDASGIRPYRHRDRPRGRTDHQSKDYRNSS